MASTDQATMEAYTGIEVTLESGLVVRGKALAFEDAVRMLKLQDLAGAGSPSALDQIMDEFPKLVGLERSAVGMLEMVAEVLPAFLSQGGTWRRIPASMIGIPAGSGSSFTSTT